MNERVYECGSEILPAIRRRTFLQLAGATAAVAAGAGVFTAGARKALAQTISFPGDPLDSDATVKVLYTTCQMCHARCGLKAKVQNGVLIKADGNPYNPTNAAYLDGTHAAMADYTADPSLAATKAKRGRICGKAQTIGEMVYNPTRLGTPLKRVGPRGAGRWVAMGWDEAINEIVAGGSLTHADGTSYNFRGLKTIYNDATDIGPDAALGKKKNGVLFSPGRHPHGNKEYTDRLFKDIYGTQNHRLDHTSICETSHHVAFTKQTSGKTSGLDPDLDEARFLVVVGENPAQASFPHQAFARGLMDAMHRATDPLEVWVVDPRLSKTAALAKQNNGRWLAVKPGYDAAWALGVIRHLIDGTLYQAAYLRNANAAAATADSETTYTDATHLVRRDTGKFLTAADAGLSVSTTNHVCLVSAAATEIGSTAVEGDLDADGVTVNGILCDSAFNLLKKQAQARTVDAWADLAGLAGADLREMAARLARGDRKASVSYYRGPVQHTNGTYGGMALNSINWLLGVVDRRGGMGKNAHWHEFGEGKAGTLYNLKSAEFTGTKATRTGPRIDRAGSNIYDSAGAAAYPNLYAATDGGAAPTKRPWFPFALNGNFQEIVPSIADQYPYAVEALISLWNVWPYSVPGGNHGIAALKDTAKLPLHVAFDVQLGELTALADYVLPDATFLELYATPHGGGVIRQQYSGIRHPVVGEYWDAANARYVPVSDWAATLATNIEASRRTGTNAATPVWGARPYYRPAVPNARSHQDVFLHMFIGTNGINPNNDAGTLGHLPGVGDSAFTTAFDAGTTATDQGWNTAWDFFKRLFSNLANEGTTVGSGLTELLAVDYVMARGGRFEYASPTPTSGNLLTHTLASTSSPVGLNFYVQDFAIAYNSMTGQTWAQNNSKGFWPIAAHVEPADALGNALDADTGYDLQPVTYKLSWHGQGRTVVNPTLMSLWPENEVVMHPDDAAARGIQEGDRVKLSSRSNPNGLDAAGRPVAGRAHLSFGIRQGVVGVSHHFGHWELGARPHVVNGQGTAHDPRRGAGLSINPVLRVDEALSDASRGTKQAAKGPVQDLVGGSVSFFDTRIKVEKA